MEWYTSEGNFFWDQLSSKENLIGQTFSPILW